MNRRDAQIVATRNRNKRLRQDRVTECYVNITRTYETESTIDQLARVVEERDRTPSDFRVISNSEARPLGQFNDDSHHWDNYCRQLARSIVHGEIKYVFEQLQGIPPTGEPIVSGRPDFGGILRGIQKLIVEGYNPDVLCAPISLFVPFVEDSGWAIDWTSSPRGILVVPGGPNLDIHWSSGLAPLNRFVILDSRKMLWTVKLDPDTSHRLTVAIGEPPSPPRSVLFLAETVAKFEILDGGAIYSIPIEGESEAID